jgi:Tfp pilus assembly protein PilF
MEGPRSIPPRPPAQRTEDEGRIFESDDSDLSEGQEFDRALAAGAELLQAGDPLAARAQLERALRFKPRNQRARNMLGLALFKLGELEKAESLYRGLIEDHPADPTLRVNLGLVFLKAGASPEAVRCFETALDLGPDHQKAMNYLGLALAQKGDHGRAREWFLRCGNAAMAERMTQALQASPLRQVAQEAAEVIEAEHPFQSALDTVPPLAEVVGALAVAAAAEQEPEVPSLPDSLTGSRWVASAPAGQAGVADLRTARQLSRGGSAAMRTQEAPFAEATGPIVAVPTDRPPAGAAPEARARTTALADYTDQQRLAIPAGEAGFLIGPTEVLIQVRGAMLTRLDGLVASFGSASMKPELKRFRGKATDKPFGEGARRMLRATGAGRFVISRENRFFTALELADEPAFFREEILFAFEESLVFENGRVPARAGPDLHLVHLRGRGRLLLVTAAGVPRSVEVTRNEPLRIPMDQLVGWHGPLIQPRLVPIVEEAPDLGVALELAGEGRALVDAPEGR